MLTKYTIRLSVEDSSLLNDQMSSLFHGALMELLPEDLADSMHSPRYHPLAQHLELRDGQWYWIVNALDAITGEAIREALSGREELLLRKKNLTIRLAEKDERVMEDSDLTQLFYEGQPAERIRIRFLSPTAFKRQGRYLFYPDIFCLYQSLMNRYDSIYEAGFADPDTLDELTQHTEIARYRLSSTLFSLEGVRIPSFLGSVDLHIRGTVTMKRFAGLLLQFGNYSGIGIKTGLGMGAISAENVVRTYNSRNPRTDASKQQSRT